MNQLITNFFFTHTTKKVHDVIKLIDYRMLSYL